MLKLETEEDFKEIPRLRYHIDENGTPIATTIKKKLKNDHLYFHRPGKLGVYYERDTPISASGAKAYWMHRCKNVILEQCGEYDGIILFKPSEIGDIPEDFFKSALKGLLVENLGHWKDKGNQFDDRTECTPSV